MGCSKTRITYVREYVLPQSYENDDNLLHISFNPCQKHGESQTSSYVHYQDKHRCPQKTVLVDADNTSQPHYLSEYDKQTRSHGNTLTLHLQPLPS